jgi:DNA-binding transcriptional LysR family regulator
MEHQVDMLLTYRLDEYESDSEFLSHIESATVGRERFLPVVGSALAERLPSASPLPYLSYSNFSFANRIILPLYEKTPCELQSVYESSLSEGIVKMLEKGIGMAWVPETLVSEQLKRGTIRRIWEDRPDLSVEVDIKLYRNKTVHRAAIETFWKAILP